MKFEFNYPLNNLNSLRTYANAKIYCRPESIQDLISIREKYCKEQKLIIGEGCNLFFTKNFDGIVIHPNIKGIDILPIENSDKADYTFIEVKASENWDKLVEYTVELGLSGLENLSLIPSSVGAAPIQNIGAYGSEVKNCIYSVTAFSFETGQIKTFTNSECDFDYRNSFFKRNTEYMIISVVFKLSNSFLYIPKYAELDKELENFKKPTLMDVRNAVLNIRKRKLPDEKELPNAGSFFKNPYIDASLAEKLKAEFNNMSQYPISNGNFKIPAAFLIDKAGFKNKRIGDVGTYPTQPLVIVNYGTKNGNDIVTFMKIIQNAVFSKFGIMLEPEVRIY